MAGASTVPQRTHTALRALLVVLIAVIFAAVAVESVRIGEVLPSISHYLYTPARGVIVGALVATGIALWALSGRNLEAALLDLAAPLAPLIALVPVQVDPSDIPGATFTCDTVPCVPESVLPEVVNGLIVWGLVIAAAAVYGIVRAVYDPPAPPVDRFDIGARTRIVIGVVGVTVIGGAVAIGAVVPAPGGSGTLLTTAVHPAAAFTFLLLVGAVAVLNAVVRTDGRRPARAERMLSITVAALLAVVFAVAVWGVAAAPAGSDIVFWVETAALGLIAVFFGAQTWWRRREADPPSLRGAGADS